MNISHHSEQMEAARRDFAELWDKKLRPRALALQNRLTLPELALLEDIAWQTFVHALKIRDDL